MTTESVSESAPAGIPRYKTWGGIALFRQGFRPFFLAVGISAVVNLATWILVLEGAVDLHAAASPVDWHAHEMIFGMIAAAVAGFLLTAIPNWTGRMPLQGWPLIGLFGLWLAGRIAFAAGSLIGGITAAAVDTSFLVVLLGVVAREIVAGRNWRNLPVTLAIALLATANIVSHVEMLGMIDNQGIGNRLGIVVILCLIVLIGGRIIPSFTNNWFAKNGQDRHAPPFSGLDRLVLVVTVVALGTWALAPDARPAALLLLVAGAGNLIRLARWAGHRTLADPLVWSLHLGYAWIPVGLMTVGLTAFLPSLSPTAGLHALTTGAMAGMVVAVMTRATLGHAGRALHTDGPTATIYVLVFLAAAARVGAALPGATAELFLMGAAVLWCAAFSLFTVRYGAILIGR